MLAQRCKRLEMKRLLKILLGSVTLTLIVFCYMGYFGGSLYTDLSATAKAPPKHSRLAAVVLSGDAGFKFGMAGLMAKRLRADGIPVIGVNSLIYFRTTRTPADATQLIIDAINRATHLFGAENVVLVGQSYGADMLQVGLARLPASLRAKVRLVALVVPEETVEFRATPGETLSFNVPEVAALPTARKLDWTTVICIRGAEETISLCPRLMLPNVKEIVMPGGHALGFDAAGLYKHILNAIDGLDPIITKNLGGSHAPASQHLINK
jgi:type IV secretory pathway VirJ component